MMRRRALLTGASLLWAAGTEEIVDTHVHFYDPSRPGGVPWPPATDKILYRRAMPADYQAVSKARVILVEASKLFADNQWILDLAAKHPFVAGCVGNLDPADAGFAGHIERFRAQPKFLGIRLSSKAAEANFALLQPLEDAGLALDLIGNGEMFELAARLSDRYPKLRLILDHLPLAKPDASIRELTGRANVYAKVSWILRGGGDKLSNHIRALDEAWDVFGENRVVYGSNWPVCDLVAPYAKVRQAAVDYFSGKSLQKYLAANSRQAYRW